MTWTQDATGSQLTVIGTEHILDSPTTNATYELDIDLTPLAAADIIEVRAYNKTLTGSTLRQVWLGVFANPQVNAGKKSPPMAVLFGAKFTIKQTAGSPRTFDWSVNRI